VKIVILVEGETEKAFMPALRRFLSQRFAGQIPKLPIHVCKGRLPTHQKLRRIVENYLKEGADAVIALTDVYTGTRDFTDAADAKAKMTQWVGQNARFYPHVALYDFEAWLLPFWPTIQKLAKHNQNAPSGTPETINHDNPPAYRLKAIFEAGKCRDSYSKTRDAKRILEQNDLLVAANACPELKAFLNTILTLGGGEVIP
jgi:hypothetical protein